MKKTTTHLIKLIFLFLLLISTVNNYGAEVTLRFEQKNDPLITEYLQEMGKDISSLKLSNYSFRNLEEQNLSDLNLIISVDGNTNLVLELTKNKSISEGFETVQISDGGKKSTQYRPGLYYKGKVKGVANSLASISFFENNLMAFISTPDKGNYIIARLNKPDMTTEMIYVFYNDINLKINNSFSCGTPEIKINQDEIDQGFNNRNSFGLNCVKIYLECDYKMYLDNGSDLTNVYNYVSGMFNQVSTLFSNETVSLGISSINVWTTPDPYSSYTNSYDYLVAFKNNTPSYNGDVAQLLSTSYNNMGGIAWLDVLCTPSYAYSFSNIYNAYSGFPTYSWDVMVVAHELGHNLGSNHTQWCGWPGGAVDDCYTTEGGCAPGTSPVTGGTIMSYCHLTGYGINFSNGFGPHPGDAIRNRVNSSTCITTCFCSSDVTISSSPASTICSGENVTFNATPTNGGSSPSYQWLINGFNAGTNSSVYSSTTLNDGDIVTCSMTSNESCASGSVVNSNAIIMAVNSTVTPSIQISTSTTTICSGQFTTFNAAFVNGGSGAVLQWKVNGVNQGINAPVYSSINLNDNDVVTCQVTSAITCASPTVALSNSILIRVSLNVTPAISISTASDYICQGSLVEFTSSVINEGISPVFQWKINGSAVGINSPDFSTTTLNNNDVVSCELLSNNVCASPTTALSNLISIAVNGGSVIPTNGLLAWYPFSGNVFDLSGNNFNGTISGARTTNDRFLNANSSYEFDGARNHVQVGNPFGLNSIAAGVSVSAWVFLGSNNSSQAAIVSKWKFNIIDDQYLLWLYNKKPNFAIGNPATGASGIQSSTVLSDSAWYHLVGTWDNTGLHSIYINGVLSNSATLPAFTTINNSSPTDLRIGTEDSTYRAFKGKIDNVRIYDRKLSDQEVELLWNEGVNPAITITTNNQTICEGDTVVCTAAIVGGGSTPGYTWKVNNVITGGNTSSFSSYTLSNQDVITCILTSSDNCISPANAISNELPFTVIPKETQSLTISTSSNPACVNDTIILVAAPSNGSLGSSYQWKINGVPVPFNISDTLKINNLINGDVISCEMSSLYPCVTPLRAISNSIVMQINSIQTPSVSITATPNPVCSNDSVLFSPISFLPGTNPIYDWYVSANLMASTSGNFLASDLGDGDLVYCDMHSNESCLTTSIVGSNVIAMNVLNVIVPVITDSIGLLFASSGSQYQWYFNSVAISGAVNQSYNPVMTGEYSVEITYADGCSEISAEFSFPTLVSDPLFPDDFYINPNPAFDNVHIYGKGNGKIEIAILSVDGKLIKKVQLENLSPEFDYTLPLENISSGIYFVQLVRDNYTAKNIKLVISK